MTTSNSPISPIYQKRYPAFIAEGSGDVKRFDGNLENQQHFKCIKCKKTIDFHHEPFNNWV